jgi:hypothetical protein
MATPRRAIDIANYTTIPTPQQVACLLNNGWSTCVVGCSYGNIAHLQLRMCAQYGMKVEAYAWITHPFSYGPIDKALGVIEGLPVKRIWLDAEADTNGRTPQQVVSDIDAAINYTRSRRPDLAIGIYTANWWWGPRTGSSTKFKDYPLWLANYVPDPTPDKVPLFGGWTKAALWQYAGTVETCGLNTDRNLILETEPVPIPPPTPTYEEDEMRLFWCLEEVKLYLVGGFGAVWVTKGDEADSLRKQLGPESAVHVETINAIKVAAAQ